MSPFSCYSDFADQVWIWDNGEGAIFYFDIGETVRFRVEAEEWHDQVPDAPDDQDGMAVMERKPPYSIIVGFFLSFSFLFECSDYAIATCG